MDDHGSNCSKGLKVDVYWRECAAVTEAEHVEEMTQELMRILKRPAQRRWSPFTEPLVRAKIRERRDAASNGILVPTDEVKVLRGGREVPGTEERIYEIRWTDLMVAEDRSDTGVVTSHTTGLRLFYSEPSALGYCMLGLVGHEKVAGDPSAEGASRRCY